VRWRKLETESEIKELSPNDEVRINYGRPSSISEYATMPVGEKPFLVVAIALGLRVEVWDMTEKE
jgi:hypothetical protein